ncbi:MAG: Restriction modification system DNA specificity domain protein [Halomonadaceae bacterium T82-2]|nr:MAG: Restriction modification system DNA specificity domain protein [Halomonadaceae bacterium T82-2]
MFEPLGKLVRLEYGQALSSDKRSGYGYPVFGSNGVVGHHECPLVTGPGIVIGRKGSVGKVAWSDTSFWPIDTTYYVESQGCDISWAYRVLDWLPLQVLDTSTGVPGLNRNDVYEISVFVPRKKEQAVIAKVLDTLDTQIQKTEALIAKLEKVKEGLLHDLLTRGIDENGRLRPSPEQAPELYKKSPLGLIPREWELCTVGGLGSWKGGSTPSKSNPGFWPESGILWVSPKDLVGDEIDETEDKISELAAHSSNLFIFPAGSVLVVFRSGILRKRLPVVRVGKNFTINQDIKTLIPSEGVAGEFVKYLLQGNADRILMKSVKAGTTVESLDYKFFSSYGVALPRKIEQHKISKIMKNMEGRISSERALIKKLKEDKAGLMDDLLTGRVRVTQLLAEAQATTPA